MLNLWRSTRRRGFTIAELIASFAVAVVIVTMVSQLVVTSRISIARNALRQRANEEILNVVEQVATLPFAMIDAQVDWGELLLRAHDTTLSRWNLSLDVSDVVSNDKLQSKRIVITLQQDVKQNPIRIRTVTWRFSNELQ